MLLIFTSPVPAQEKFKETRSLSQYVHHITLYDAAGVAIDPTSPNARPYSPRQTCMKCHDYKSISHGYHFNAGQKLFADATGKEHELSDARPGEPWIFSDARSGAQIPLSLRDWPGTHKPEDIGLTRLRYLVEFGRQMPGGGVGESAKPQAAPDADAARFNISGNLEIDCMICHSADREYSHERWMKQVSDQNFAWAATYALGIGSVKGSAKTLPDDFDPSKAADPDAGPGAPKLPEVKYDKTRFAEDGTVFIDIIRTPSNNACYACHTTRRVGDEAPAKWLHDEDVHVKAGIACAECNRNDIGHHTIRGFEGEKHPTGSDVPSFSCRGCHLDHNDPTKHDDIGGRLGAPKPLHKGIPPIHFDLMSCTSCHSGPLPGDRTTGVQTAMAHAFGLATQTREDDDLPLIVQPVFRKVSENGKDVIYPYRQLWPAYFGTLKDGKVTPMEPNQVDIPLRRSLRIRSDFREEASKINFSDDDRKAALGEAAAKSDVELTPEQKKKLDDAMTRMAAEKFRENLAKALAGLKTLAGDGTPVYVSGGKLYQPDGKAAAKVVAHAHAAAEPYAWPLGHDVRPARQSLGVLGCTECHAKGSPIFYSRAVAQGPAPDDAPIALAMHEIQGHDAKLMDSWEMSFGGRAAFKWIGFIAIGTVAVIVVLFALITLGGLLRVFRPRGG